MQYYPAERRRQHVWQAQMYDLQLADKAAAAKPIAGLLDAPQAREYAAAERLMQDVMLGLYKNRPEPQPLESIAPSSRLNQAILEQAQSEARWGELRATTRLDEAMAILGTAALGAQIFTLLDEEMKQEAQQAAESEAEAQRQQALADALAEMIAQGQGTPQAQQRLNQAQQAASQAQQQAQEAAAKAVGAFQGNGSAQRALRAALKAAAEGSRDDMKRMSGWGLGPGAAVPVSPEERLALAGAIKENRLLREIGTLAGRLKNIALAIDAAKIPTQVGDIHGIELGRDLARLIPFERAKMLHPLLNLDFRRRFAESQLIQYKISERSKAALGPLVVVWDESGSMQGPKEIRAKAIALALLALAQRQCRPWGGVAFSSGGQVRSVKFERPHQDIQPRDLVDLASHFYGGGTDFELGLTAAREIIGEQAFVKADIIFTTDGIAALSDAYLKDLLDWKARTGVRIFTIIVSGGDDESVKAWSDRVESDAEIFTNPRQFDAVAESIFAAV